MFLKLQDKTAIVWKTDKISYTQLLQHVDLFTKVIPEGTEKIAILSPNKPEWVYAFYAGWKRKSVVVPIDFMAKYDEIAYILNDCKPEIIFCSTETLQVFEDAKKLLNFDIRLVILEDVKNDILSDTPSEDFDVSDMNKTAVIIYTSGTTGFPKGVMLSFDNLLANVEAVSEHIPIYNANRNVLVLLPLHHIFPLMGSLIIPLKVGSTIAFSPSMISEDILNTLQQNQIAIIIGVPRLYEAIRKGVVDKINANKVAKTLFKVAKKLNSRSFSKKVFKKVHDRFGGKVEYLVCGGAKLNEKVAEDYKALGFEMLEGFGMTEAAPMITFTRPNRWKIGSAGEPVHTLEVKSMDGEIVARGRNIMKGYYNRPDETAEVIKDGWLHTGDIGYLDKEGFIHITGRTKEIIVLSNGKNVNPEEIEFKLNSITPYIAEVAAFSVNDMINAVIYPDFKKTSEAGVLNLEEFFKYEVIEKYNKSVSPYKKISKFILSKDELPKTRLGKIQRYKLSSVFESISKGEKKIVEEPNFEEYQVIRDFLKEQKQIEVSPNDHLELDLSLDSLDKVNLQVFLESTFGIDVKEEVLINNPTVEKLSRFMKEKKNKLSVETVRWAEILKEKVDLKLPKSWFTQNLFKNFSRVFFKLYFRIKGEGVQNLPEGPFIITPNHQSFFDGLFVSVFLKNKTFKNTYFYAKEKHLRNPLVRAFASRNNVVVMDINKDLKESLQKLATLIKQGKNIIIFPEGSRSKDGDLGEFKKFFAILSLELNVPIVPVSINGAFKALPKGSIIPRPWKRIKVKFHKPVYPDGHNYDTLTSQVHTALSKEIDTK